MESFPFSYRYHNVILKNPRINNLTRFDTFRKGSLSNIFLYFIFCEFKPWGPLCTWYIASSWTLLTWNFKYSNKNKTTFYYRSNEDILSIIKLVPSIAVSYPQLFLLPLSLLILHPPLSPPLPCRHPPRPPRWGRWRWGRRWGVRTSRPRSTRGGWRPASSQSLRVQAVGTHQRSQSQR